MKIALLSAANSVHTVKIANGLAGLGHAVALYSLAAHADPDNAVDPAVTVTYLPKKGYAANAKALKQGLAAFGPDVLYAHYATGYGTLARRAAFHPTVLAVWGSDVYDFPRKSPFHAALLRRNLAFADAVFSTSRCMARRTMQYTAKQPLVTPFGVDLNVFRPQPHARGQVCIGFLKTVAPKYGLDVLLRAFAQLTRKRPDLDVTLSVYGDGPKAEAMQALSRTLGVAEKVTFFGRVPHADVPAALQTMDIFCAPSTLNSESFGVAAVEAMACGLPCVVSDVDGLQEVTRHGETGLTVPRRNADALCDALIKLTENGGLRRTMGQAARERAAVAYDWQNNLRTIERGLAKAAGKQ